MVLNLFLPEAIKVILLLGGFYLAYEGVEKIIEYFFHKNHVLETTTTEPLNNELDLEKTKIKSAITTDFILSVEIVIIALSTVLDQNITLQIITVSVVSILATIGVYGLVGIIVRMDDVGYSLIKKSNQKGPLNTIGIGLVKTLPLIIKFFAIVGTIALVLVSGGIFEHNIDYLHHILPNWPNVLKELCLGLLGGLIALLLVHAIKFTIRLIK